MHMQLWEKVSRVSKKRLLLCMLFFFVLLLGVIIYRLIEKNNWLKLESEKQEIYVQQKEAVEKLDMYIKAVESESRGYALTGNKRFLQNFNIHLDSINSIILQLNVVDVGIRTTVQYLKLESLIQQKISFLQKVNALITKNRASGISLTIGNESADLSNSISFCKQAVVHHLQVQMNQSKISLRAAKITADNTVYYSLAVSLMLILIFFFFLVKEIISSKGVSKELELQKERYRTTLSSMTEGVITTDRAGSIIYMNPAAEVITGWKKKEAKNLPLHKVYDVSVESSGEPIENIVSRILKEGIPVELENNTVLKTRYRNEVIISNSGSPLFDSGGKITGAVLVFNDITAEKKNRLQLKESEERYRMIIEQATDAVIVYSYDGTIYDFNKAAYTQSGYTKKEFETLRLQDLLFDEPVIVNQANATKVIAGETVLFTRKLKCKDGSASEIEINSKLLPDGCILAFVRDVTERKQAEVKLKKALERYNILAKATSDTIWDWDIQTNRMSYNKGITTMLGYDKSVVKNIPGWWKQNIHPDDFTGISELLNEVFHSNRQTFHLSYRFRCADGGYKYIFDRAFVMYDEQGKPLRIIGAMQDVTYQKEEEMRISRAIVDAQEAERQQLGMELHDNVNQILSVSLLYLGIARKQQKDTAEFSETINICKKHISDAINEIRKLSHQLAPASKDDISFKDVFESLIESLTRNCTTEVRLYFDEFDADQISYDIQTALYRILQEQMNNVFKYAEADTVEVDVLLNNNTISLRIADNGKGFDPKLTGKGIGLGNIKRRTEMHGGKYSCYSSPGQGCEIIVSIPL